MMIGIKTRKVYHISESDSMYLEVAGSFFGSWKWQYKAEGISTSFLWVEENARNVEEFAR